LGPQVDVHGGGKDLKFPHHESEAMICEAIHGTEWSRCWMHNGFLEIQQEKMSKSLGNFVTIRDVLAKWSGETVRFCLLKEHYRKDVEYDADCFRIAKEQLDAIYGAIAKARAASVDGGTLAPIIGRAREKFFTAMDDDFDTANAVYALLELTEAVGEVDRVSKDDARQLLSLFEGVSRILGVLDEPLRH